MSLLLPPLFCPPLILFSTGAVYPPPSPFSRSFELLLSIAPSTLVIGVSPVHGLFGGAGEDGLLECWDVRQRSSIGSLDVAAAAGAGGQQLTAMRFDDSGLMLAAGTSNGLVALFDLR